MLEDVRGLAVTAANADAVAALDGAVACYCGLRRDAGEHLKRALTADPDLPMGHVLRGYFMMLFGKREFVPRAVQAAAAGEAVIARVGATARERLHLASLQEWIGGRLPGAAAVLENVLAQHPRDLLAARLAQHLYFFMGESRAMSGSVERILPAWHRDVPGFGFVLGCHAFGLEETSAYAAAERAGRDALALNKHDVWAAHAVAHVFEMQNRIADGLAWLDARAGDWGKINNFVYHVHWHRCLFLLERGDHAEVLARYDREVRPESTDEQLDISNAVALLWRLEQRGVDVGGRWAELAAQSRNHVDDHLLVFPDIHYAMAMAAARDEEGLRLWRDAARRYADTSREHEAAVMAEVGLALADAAIAHRRGRWAEAVAGLLPIRHAFARIGGSHAQRDLFHRLMIDAALEAQRSDLAIALLAERGRTRSRDRWGSQALARAEAGDPRPTALTA